MRSITEHTRPCTFLLKFTFFGRDAENDLLIDSFLGKGALTWPKLLTLLNEFYLIFSMLMCSLHHSPSDQVQNGRIFAKNIVF